jgi:hypothetical protein
MTIWALVSTKAEPQTEANALKFQIPVTAIIPFYYLSEQKSNPEPMGLFS